jgi:hypothetical protein
MRLKVCHYPQVPCRPFEVEIDSLEKAKLIMDTLADYDLFQFNNHIKPDYANATVLRMWDNEDNDWTDWNDEETGIDDLDEYFEYLENKTK